MTRKFAWWGLSYLLGLVLFAADWGESFVIFSLAAVVAGVLLFVTFGKYRVYVLSVTLCLLLGLLSGKLYTMWVYETVMSYDGQTVVLDGYITDFSYTGSDVCRITVKGSINGEQKTSVTYFAQNDNFDYYQYVRVTGKVSAISDNLKFDAESYNRPRGVFLQGDSTPQVEILGGCHSNFMRLVLNFRDYASQLIRDNTGEKEGAFLTAMLCGDKTDMDDVTKTMLYRSGIGHLFAVSGTHLAVIAMFFGFIINRLVSSKRLRFLLIEGAILIFIAFAGFAPSVVRSGIMMSAVQCSSLFGRKADTMNSLGICSAAMCVLNPYLVRNVSFSMSLAAAFAIGVVAPALNRTFSGRRFAWLLRSFVSVTVVIFVTLPLAAAYFTEVSVISPVTNLFAIPLCTVSLVMVMIGVLTGGGVISAVILKAAGVISGVVIRLAEILSGLSFAAVPTCWFWIIMICFVFATAGIIYSVKSGKFRVYVVMTGLVYCGIYAAVIFASYASKDVVHAAVFPGKGSCTAVIYQDGDAFVIDLKSKGEYVATVQNFGAYYGIERIAAAFIYSGADYTQSVYDASLLPKPEAYYSQSETAQSGLIPLETSASLHSFTVTATEEGYILSAYGNSLELYDDTLKINGREYDLSHYESQMMIFSFGAE